MNFRFTRVELPRLKELTTNNIAAFGSILGRFTTLEKLQVSGKLNEQALTSLTASLNQLNRLKFLVLEGTGITSMDWCGSMLDLEYLNLGHNAIKTIPDSLDKLQKLKTIVLRNNPIPTIPGLKPMPQVTFIDLEDTKIPIDENASTNIQPVREELIKLKQAFPNVEYLSMMEVTVQSSTGQ